MRNSATCFALAALLAAGATCASAAMIKCVDDKGVTHYGDTMPAQCAGQASAELNKRGVVIRKTERSLTTEELKAKEVQSEQRRLETQKDADQKRRDYALMASYTNEREIDAARQRELQRVENRLATIKSSHAKPASPEEQKKVDDMIETVRKEIDAINARFDGYKTRFIELKKAQGGTDKVTKL